MGGLFFRFAVGRPGHSAATLRYLSRPSAVRDGLEGVRLWGLPEAVTRAHSLADLRANLIAYAATREIVERRRGRGRRTHYRVLMSFETAVPSRTALDLAGAWLQAVLPQARAAAFYHTDTTHGHLHLWLEARQRDGRKITLSAAQYRQLDEAWNQCWARALGRDTAEHRAKKRETEAYKALRRAGHPAERPVRAGRRLGRGEYQRRERHGVGVDELERGGPGGNQSETALRAADGEPGERTVAPGEGPLDDSTRACAQAVASGDGAAAAERDALSALDTLHQAAAHLAQRARSVARGRERG